MDHGDHQRGNMPNSSEEFGKIRNGAESFGTLPEDFGKVPNDSERFRTFRNLAERTEHHTLTVRDAARLFEQAGVSRTERSIVNWCQSNAQGVARLDAFYDTNDRKYFLTPASVERAIREEQAKQASTGQPLTQTREESIRKDSESGGASRDEMNENVAQQNKLRDLEITNRVKDQFISMIENERDRLLDEREKHVHELMAQSHHIGRLEAELKLLGESGAARQPPVVIAETGL